MKTKILGLLAVGLLAGPMATQATGVVVRGIEWRQLTETTGFSWTQVANVCDSTTGSCRGFLDTVSFDGWTWAGNTDIQVLFQALIPPASNFPTSTSLYAEDNSAAIDAMIGPGAFTATHTAGQFQVDYEILNGWSRTQPTPDAAYSPLIWDEASPVFADNANLRWQDPVDSVWYARGVWLFRPMPEPGTLALLILGLLGLGLSRRRA